ncbi:hypothetical protein BP6252_06442 [Coleophoma cylindrospora]|uniref:GDP-mannose transporter n=1 Tax=Coleophoma cylindrospora TaxID=1849047 RepID=A0A3D8RMY2_9HELO|nr:hypothetical protein BP6252_06442 [Coleophoma cylindrospora]
MSSSNKKDSCDYRGNSIPLITISRSPSPSVRRRSESNPSETEDEDFDQNGSSLRPFLSNTSDTGKRRGWRGFLVEGGLGQWLFSTPTGWQVYVGILVLWLGGCGIGLTIMNRIILWTGVYKFPYPLATTFLEMLLTHGLLLASAALTRIFSSFLVGAGLSGMIAPSHKLQSQSPPGFRGPGKRTGFLPTLARWTSSNSGGIAGGGLFEFDMQVVRQVLPLAVIFVAKLILSNLSFAYAQLPIYVLARIGIVPISLILTAVLGNSPHSVATISSVLTGTITLFVAAVRPHIRVTWESIVAGVFSSLFVALYPIQLQRTYKTLVASLVPQGDLLTSFTPYSQNASAVREEARATWRLMHYTSLLSILIFFPILLLSGEVGNISRNCYFLDVFFHWLMVTCGGLGSWAVFFGTVLLTKATSPLTTTFLFIPRAAFMLPIMAKFKMPAYSWVGIVMCWASCAWFLMGRMRDGRSGERLR